jgi:hypothetical protein
MDKEQFDTFQKTAIGENFRSVAWAAGVNLKETCGMVSISYRYLQKICNQGGGLNRGKRNRIMVLTEIMEDLVHKGELPRGDSHGRRHKRRSTEHLRMVLIKRGYLDKDGKVPQGKND